MRDTVIELYRKTLEMDENSSAAVAPAVDKITTEPQEGEDEDKQNNVEQSR